MIYYYVILIEYKLGGKGFIMKYEKSFVELCDFFIWLKKKHKDNFTIISIKEKKRFPIIK